MNLMTVPTNILLMTAWSTALTMVSVMAIAVVEGKSPTAPVIAISHILYGDKAIGAHSGTWIKFAIGFVLNLMAMVGWSAIAELLFRVLHIGPSNMVATIFVAVIVTVLAYFTDYHLVPKRFTPGFEHVLSRRALFVTYGFLALSFFIGGLERTL